MKKIPTLFEREFEGHCVTKILPNPTAGLEWVLTGQGVATVKWDGACCAIISGVFYRRYDAKHGKPVPNGAIKCQKEPDPITGHHPCWVKCERDNPADRWFWVAYDSADVKPTDGTYEAVGPHFQSNPYALKTDRLIRHGSDVVEVGRSFEEIRGYLESHNIEGLVLRMNIVSTLVSAECTA